MSRLYLLVRIFGKHVGELPQETKVFLWSIVFLISLYFVPNNKMLLLTAGIFVGGLYSILNNFVLAIIYSAIFFLPFHNGKSLQFLVVPARFVYGNIPFTMSITFTLSMFMIGVLVYIYLRQRFSNPLIIINVPNDTVLGVFLSAIFLSAAFSGMPALSFLLAVQICCYVFLYYFIRVFNLRKKVTEMIRPMIIALGLFEGSWSLMQFINKGTLGKSIEGIDPSLTGTLAHAAGEDLSFFRMQGTFSHPNNLGYFMAVFSPILLFYSLTRKTPYIYKILAAAGFILSTIGLMLSASRASWILFMLAMYLVFRIRIIRSAFEVVPFVRRIYSIFFVACIAFIPAYVLPRLSQFSTTFGTGGGAEYRRFLLEKAFAITTKNPFGVGLGMFPKVLFEEIGGFTSFPTQPHNLIAQILVASGFIGCAAFIFFLYFQFTKYFRAIMHDRGDVRAFRLIGGISLLNYLLLSMLYPILTEQQIFGWFWVLLIIFV